MKTARGRLVAAVSLIVAVAVCSAPTVHAADQVQKIQISSASIGQSAHFFATTWSKLINTKTQGLLATNAATGGFVENLQLLGQGKTDVGYLSALNLVKARAGDRSLISEKELSVLRGIYSYRAGAIHVVVLADSPIRSIADLKGKKVTAGPAGGVTRTFLRDILETGGLRPGSYAEHVLSTTGGVEALKDGVVDAVCTGGVAPLPILIDLLVSKKIRILPLDEQQVQRLSEKVPSYVREVIPRDIYGKNLVADKDIVTAGSTSMAATHVGMDREVIYKITKVLFANLEEYYTSHPSAKRTSLEDPWPGMVIPLHPGALRYYREAGKDVPARLLPPEQ